MASESVLGRYRIEAPLGMGGVAEVLRAVDVQTGAAVAVKRLLRQHAADALMRARFVREAELNRALSHTNILPVIDAGEAGGVPVIVMPLAEGGDLEHALAGGFEPLPRLARVVGRALAHALVHAHAAGVVHRDIKPHNVLIRRDEALPLLNEDDFVLSDFGMARLQSLATMTGASLQWGSPHYMAPELLRGERADARSDLYALGVLLYELMSGRQPWSADAPLARLKQQRLAPLDTDDYEMDALVMAMLEWEPRHRPASAKAVLASIDGVRARPVRTQEVDCPSCGRRRRATALLCFACGKQEEVPLTSPKGQWHVLLRRMDVDAARLERLHALVARFSGKDDVSLQVVQTQEELNQFPKGHAAKLPVSLFAGLDEQAARAVAQCFASAGFDVVAAKPWFKHKASPIALQVCAMAAGVGALYTFGIPPRGFSIISYSLLPIGLLVQHLWARHTTRLIQPRAPMLQLRPTTPIHPQTVAVQERLSRLRPVAASAHAEDLVDQLAAAMITITSRVSGPDVSEVAQAQVGEWVEQTLAWVQTVVAKLAELEDVLSARSESQVVREHATAERRLKNASGEVQSRLLAVKQDLEAALAKRHDLEQQRDRILAELRSVMEQAEAAANSA